MWRQVQIWPTLWSALDGITHNNHSCSWVVRQSTVKQSNHLTKLKLKSVRINTVYIFNISVPNIFLHQIAEQSFNQHRAMFTSRKKRLLVFSFRLSETAVQNLGNTYTTYSWFLHKYNRYIFCLYWYWIVPVIQIIELKSTVTSTLLQFDMKISHMVENYLIRWLVRPVKQIAVFSLNKATSTPVW